MNTVKITVSKSGVEEFLAFVSRMNKRAAKHGVSLMVVKEIGECVKERRKIIVQKGEEGEVSNDSYMVHCVEFEVEHPVMAINGWKMAASVETTEAGNIIHSLPASEDLKIPDQYRSSGSACEHCATNRKRKLTYLLFNSSSNSFKQVGSDCLTDFLGHDASAFEFESLMVIELKDWDGEWEGCGMYSSRAYSLLSVLVASAACAREIGFVSRKEAADGTKVASADHVSDFLSPNFRGKIPFKVEPQDEEKGKKVLEWMQGLQQGQNDYITNLAIVAQAGFVSVRSLGLVVSAISAYGRHLEAMSRLAADANSQHVGAEGERMEMVVECLNIISRETDYGAQGIHKLRDDKGNILTWFASGTAGWLEVGKVYKVKATVTKHGDYKGIKQTIVNRVKIIKDKAAA